MIRTLNINEIENLYKERIRKDFPLMERRPLFIMKRLYAQNRYQCLVLEEENQILAYASFLCDQSIHNVLLDYFAVEKNLRGSGVGSKFFSLLSQYWTKKDSIILECENPTTTKNQTEKVIRERRISFYTRGGAIKTTLDWKIFGVNYNILWLPIHSEMEEDTIDKDLIKLYTLSLPSFIRKLFLKKRNHK